MPDIVLLSDPRIAEIPVKECDEPLVDLRTLRTLRVDERLSDAEGSFAHVRLSVAGPLIAAQARLPRPLRLPAIASVQFKLHASTRGGFRRAGRVGGCIGR